MKTSILSSIAFLILSLTTASAQESSLPQDLQKLVSEWRSGVLPAIQPGTYWPSLKELGSKIGEVNERRIETSGASDIDSALALVAYHAMRNSDKVEELSAWYGRSVNYVQRKTWEQMNTKLNQQGLSRIEIHRALAHGWSPKQRRVPPVMPLIVSQHKQEEFLFAWEAWMLSPSSGERNLMRQRMNEALSVIGNERTIAVVIQKSRVLPEHVAHVSTPENLQELIQTEADEIRLIIRSIGGKAAVLGLLECVRIAEAKAYAGEGHDSVRNLVLYSLTSNYNPRELAANPEWEESLRAPGNTPRTPGALTPYDDKWKEFKPIIEEMLKNPKDLRAEDISLLQDILAAMPKN